MQQPLAGKLLMLIQEDKTPSHAFKYQVEIFRLHELWPGNSPDMNIIEPCWPWMKRTTKKGAPRTRTDAEARRKKSRLWIERMP